jgi:hypothetical protein
MPDRDRRPAELTKSYREATARLLPTARQIPPENTVMSQNESVDLPIKIADILTSADLEVLILGYDLKADAYLCDVFNLDGKLIGLAMPIRATIIETCFRKKG